VPLDGRLNPSRGKAIASHALKPSRRAYQQFQPPAEILEPLRAVNFRHSHGFPAERF